jgi:hypothetical protein
MSPFASDPVSPRDQLPVDDQTATDASAQDHGKCKRCTLGGAIHGFGQGETIRIVFDPNRSQQQTLQIGLQGLAIEAGRIGVAHGTRIGGDRTGDTHADRGTASEFTFRPFDQINNRPQRGAVISLGSRYPPAQPFPIHRIEHDNFNLGTPKVKADSHQESPGEVGADSDMRFSPIRPSVPAISLARLLRCRAISSTPITATTRTIG